MRERKRILWTAAGLAVAAVAAVVAFIALRADRGDDTALRTLDRAALELRDGVLFVKGEPAPFDGTVTEEFPRHAPRTELEIRAGKPHGTSRGWYESGQLEVVEHFVDGVSHGTRTRWHANGQMKSKAEIADGLVVGVFTRWHDNGQLAARVAMDAGQPHGLSEAWDRDGRRTARMQMERGEVVSRELAGP